MFNSGIDINGRCRRCLGSGRLRMVVETLSGRFVRYENEITCDLCDGKNPLIFSAAQAALRQAEEQAQQP